MELIRLVPVCEALKSVLINSEVISDLVNRKNLVDNEVMNYNPSNTPWIGIYPGTNSGDLIPFTLGKNSFKNDIALDVYIQVASIKNKGKEAMIKLETLLKEVVKLVSNEPTINGSVNRVTSMKAENSYLTDKDNPNFYFPTVTLTIFAEVRL